MKTFWDEQQEKLKKEEERRENAEKIKAIIGRDYNLPSRVVGYFLHTGKLDPAELLRLGGYKKIATYGFIINLARRQRFHAYVTSDGKIHMHRDIPGNISKHQPVVWGVKQELLRLRQIAKRLRGIDLPHPNDRPGKKKKGKGQALPRAEYLEAMARLKQERESVAHENQLIRQ